MANPQPLKGFLSSRQRKRGLAFAACVLLGLMWWVWPTNPFRRFDICFEEDYPGATDRYTTYTPVRCSNPSARLGEPIGADYGNLSFEDVDDDGTPELVVESSRLECSFAGYCGASREVWKVSVEGTPRFTEFQHVELPFGTHE